MFSERDMGGSDTDSDVYVGDPLSELAEAQGDRVDHPRKVTNMIDEPLTEQFVRYLEMLTGRSFDQYVEKQGGRAAIIAELEAILADFPEGQTLRAELALEVLRHESRDHVMQTLGMTIAEKEAVDGEFDFNKTEFTHAVGSRVDHLMANRGEKLVKILVERITKSHEA